MFSLADWSGAMRDGHPQVGVHYTRSLGEFRAWFAIDADCLTIWSAVTRRGFCARQVSETDSLLLLFGYATRGSWPRNWWSARVAAGARPSARTLGRLRLYQTSMYSMIPVRAASRVAKAW